MSSRKYIYSSILLLLCLSLVWADKLHHINGKVIEGRILKEDDERVWIETQEYGTLPFEKVFLKKIEYTDRPSLTPSPSPESQPPAEGTPSTQQDFLSKILGQVKSLGTDTTGQQPAAPSPKEEATPLATPSLEKEPPALVILPGFDAILFDLAGEVQVRHAGGEWDKAMDKLQLKIGDELMAGKGKAKLMLRGRGELRIPPGSQLVIEKVSPDGSEVTVRLKGGRVWNHITPGTGVVQYTINTPDLTAGVIGTLFKVSINEAEGSRVAVFEGKVLTVSERTKEQTIVEADNAVVVDTEGQLSAPEPVSPEERREWSEWDDWALEVHEQVAVWFPHVGGQVISDMARQIAEDGKRHEQMTQETNQRILTNREEDRLNELSNAFLQFYRDTGVMPTNEQGFEVLMNDPDMEGWNGPYLKITELPPRDRWGQAILYELRQSPVSGNYYGVVISSGPDKIYSKGQVDDLMVIIKYFAEKRP